MSNIRDKMAVDKGGHEICLVSAFVDVFATCMDGSGHVDGHDLAVTLSSDLRAWARRNRSRFTGLRSPSPRSRNGDAPRIAHPSRLTDPAGLGSARRARQRWPGSAATDCYLIRSD